MGMNETPRGERVHIALFGKRNAGKSSLINALTDQNIAIVSDYKGTTTDPVYKAMELLPIGPVVIIDTPGLDDEGELGQLRIAKSKEVLAKTDIALIVIDSKTGVSNLERDLLREIKMRKVPCMVLYNKIDLADNPESVDLTQITDEFDVPVIAVSAITKTGIEEVKKVLGKRFQQENEKKIVGDLIEPGDFVVLVVPIDKAAPKGRLILPQQQTIRDVLDHGGISIVVRDFELADTLASLGKKPKLVITDSQAFGKVSKIVPKDILLTSFSILFARYKGELYELVKAAKTIEDIRDGDMILMGEGCTHHRQCDDIGTVKIPKWIREYTKKDICIETSSGTGFPEDLSRYAMIVHCGACTLNEKEMKNRMRRAKEQKIPMVNYGVLIAYMNGILKRSIEPFRDIKDLI